MIHRMDPPEDPEREPAPEGLRPMNATLGTRPPTGDGWAWELKWDGIRALAYVDGGRIRLFTRNGNEVTHRYPELRGLGVTLGSARCGARRRDRRARRARAPELRTAAAADARREPEHHPPPRRRGARGLHGVRRAVARRPLLDVVAVSRSTRAPAGARAHRRVVAGAAARGRRRRGDVRGERTFRARRCRREAPRQHLRAGPPVAPVDQGQAHDAPGVRRGRLAARRARAARHRRFAARRLLRRRRRRARSSATRRASAADCAAQISSTSIARSPSSPARRARSRPGTPPKGARFVDPELVVDVRFTDWTNSGGLRAPVFLGYRTDKPAAEVERERPS